VRIIESGHDKVPAKVDHLGLAPLELLYVLVGSDRHDPAITDRQRLHTRRLRLRVDVPVDEDRVRQLGHIICECPNTNH
jgi:hypothetical protein